MPSRTRPATRGLGAVGWSGSSPVCPTRVCVRRRRGRGAAELLATPHGWGRLILHRNRPQAGKRWTETGEYHDERGLKNRPPRGNAGGEAASASGGDVEAACLHVRHGRRWAALLHRTGSGHQCTTYHWVWHEARDFGLPPALASTPLAKRPYDLRHSVLSTWLYAGTPSACTQQSINNQRVEGLLSSYDQSPALE